MCIFIFLKSLYGSFYPPHKTAQYKAFKKEVSFHAPKKYQRSASRGRLMKSQKVETQSIFHCCLPSSQGNYEKGKKKSKQEMGRETHTLHISFVRCLLNIDVFSKPLNLLLQYLLTVCACLSHTYFCVHSLITVRCLQHSRMYFSSGTRHPFMLIFFCIFRGLSTQERKFTDEVMTFY